MSTSADGTGPAVERDNAGNWPKLARQWAQVGPPLRPVAQDVEFCWDAVSEWMPGRGTPRVLLLGVTPELYRMPWPKGTDLLAVDHTPAMVEAVWPGPKEAVLCADWLALDLPGGSRDIALCDGGLHHLAYPQGQAGLVRVLRGALSDGGLCILRLYTPPARRESPQAVLRDLQEGRISNLNILKVRLGAAMTADVEQGVELDAVWRALQEAALDLDGLAARLGWPAEHMRVIHAYCGEKAHYHYVTVDQVCGLFCGEPGGFELIQVRVPAYELGEQFPTVVLKRRARREA